MYEGALSRPMSDDADRGQLLVIVGLIIAVSFIGLAVALNAAIFSENLSTRESVDAEEAAAYTAGVEPAIGDAYDETNDGGAATAADARTEFGDLLGEWETAKEREAAREGADFGLNRTAHVGWRLEQDANRSFTPEGNASATDWTVADGVQNISAFELSVKRTKLYNGADTAAFHVFLSDGTDTWKVFVYRDGSDNIVVSADDPPTPQCTRTTNRAVINVSNGSVAGTDCDALDLPASLDGTLEVKFQNVQSSGGDERVNGTYTVIVNGSDAIDTDTDDEPIKFNRSGEAPPTAAAVVYAVNYTTTYERADVEHHRDGRYAPRAELY